MKRGIRWFRSLSRGKQIACVVFLLHGTLTFFLCTEYWISSFQKNLPRTHQKIAVRTIAEPPTPRISEKPASSSLPTTRQKQPAKPPAKKSNSPTKRSEQEAILKEIATSLKALSSAPSPDKPEIAVPIFSDLSLQPIIDTPSIQEQICLLLQETLQLPEFGEVKVALSIDRVGQLQSLTVLASKSIKNEEFLKNRLPQLQFPCLNEEISLTIVFSNAL